PPRDRSYRRLGAIDRAAGGERCLGRRQPGDRDPERRAGDVVHLECLAEGDRTRLAAVFAADTQLEVGARAAAEFAGHLDQLSDADLVEYLKWVGVHDARFDVMRQEL